MCTATVHRRAGEVVLTMNRDERRNRAPERPPFLRGGEAGGVAWAGPADGAAGGTWLGASELGVAACLLNLYLPHEMTVPPPVGAPSRGRIIGEALAQGGMAEIEAWLGKGFDPTPYPSFTLVVAGVDRTLALSWEGRGELRRSTLEGEWAMATSSAWHGKEVMEFRAERFEAWKREGAPHDGPLPTFHLFQPEGLIGWGPLMERPSSRTRSVTQARLNARALRGEILYWGDPHAKPLGEPERLEFPLRPAAAQGSHPGA